MQMSRDDRKLVGLRLLARRFGHDGNETPHEHADPAARCRHGTRHMTVGHAAVVTDCDLNSLPDWFRTVPPNDVESPERYGRNHHIDCALGAVHRTVSNTMTIHEKCKSDRQKDQTNREDHSATLRQQLEIVHPSSGINVEREVRKEDCVNLDTRNRRTKWKGK